MARESHQIDAFLHLLPPILCRHATLYGLGSADWPAGAARAPSFSSAHVVHGAIASSLTHTPQPGGTPPIAVCERMAHIPPARRIISASASVTQRLLWWSIEDADLAVGLRDDERPVRLEEICRSLTLHKLCQTLTP